MAVMLLSALDTIAQPGIYVCADSCTGTITRFNPSDNSQVHYMKTGDRSGKFLFSWQYDNPLPIGNGKYRTINISGYDVKDFTITGDTIYFCGDEPNGRGFYGYVRMVPTNYATVNMYSLYTDADTSLTDIRRIRVFYSDNGVKHVLLIATYVCPESTLNRSSIVDVRDDSVCTVRLTTDEHFDDVAVLDSNVVTVSRKGGLNPYKAPLYLRVLDKDSFDIDNTLFTTYYYGGGRSANGRILLQWVGGNNFVSVYHQDTAFFINTYTVDISHSLHMQRRYSVRENHEAPIADVAYNDNDSSFTIIHRQADIGTATEFDCRNFPTLLWQGSLRPDLDSYCPGCQTMPLSVTKTAGTTYRASGTIANKMFVWLTNSACNHFRMYRVYMENSSVYSGSLPPEKKTMGIHHTSYTISIRTCPFSFVCLRQQDSSGKTDDEITPNE